MYIILSEANKYESRGVEEKKRKGEKKSLTCFLIVKPHQ